MDRFQNPYMDVSYETVVRYRGQGCMAEEWVPIKREGIISLKYQGDKIEVLFNGIKSIQNLQSTHPFIRGGGLGGWLRQCDNYGEETDEDPIFPTIKPMCSVL